MSLVTTDAVVLHAFDYLETSRILRLATRDAGVQSVLARGARRSARRFGAALDLFATGVAQIRVRPGRELQQLEAFDVMDARAPLAANLERFSAASAMAELAMRWMPDDAHDTIYDVLTAALDTLGAAPPGRACDAGLGGLWRLVAALGFAPVLDVCALCHDALDRDAAVRFGADAGGGLCANCAPQAPGSRTLPADARDAIRAWINGAPNVLGDTREQRAHLRLLREFLGHHLSDGRPLKALEAWERAAARARSA